jgi:hypothetical protein
MPSVFPNLDLDLEVLSDFWLVLLPENSDLLNVDYFFFIWGTSGFPKSGI